MSNSAIAIRMTIVSIIIKMLVFTMHWQHTNYERVYFFANVFILMTGVFFGIRQYKKAATDRTDFLQDIKSGMRIAALYAILMTAFVYAYYEFIDPAYFTQKLEMQLQLAAESDIDLEKAKQMGQFALSPFFQSTVTLIGFMILGSFYASMITFLLRRVKGFANN